MKTSPTAWTEADVQQFIGQPESFTLEFTASALMTTGANFARGMARNVSAFANAEGGLIIIGMQENRGRPRVALELHEGVTPAEFSLEQLQHLVNFCIRPHLPGIQCHAVPLSDARAGRVAYVVSVPKGDTAYQANDYRYYTRNGSRCDPLEDHLVRLLMLRGQTAAARLEIANRERLLKDNLASYRFDLLITNTGKQTIDDFLLGVRLTLNTDELQLWAPTLFVDSEEAIQDELKSVASMLEIGESIDAYKRHEMLHGPGIPFQPGDELRASFRRTMQLLYQVDGRKIFPQDRVVFPGGKWLIESVPAATPLAAYQPRMQWTIYLDNALPCIGEIDISAAFA